eukprot:CAMPEP_0172651754 /NCGR_PEP_ID=MMETSP1068-20121228/242971_1 /TAXON_ID=35684 /ORGANISM="Pseudopedinella elastica, Strain CCMP716" /LENGTH=141 /DNA_ID=CAMNT_0013466157 /DNA_START=246 /DNA_END=671 /DNA_ORIENTATION=+
MSCHELPRAPATKPKQAPKSGGVTRGHVRSAACLPRQTPAEFLRGRGQVEEEGGVSGEGRVANRCALVMVRVVCRGGLPEPAQVEHAVLARKRHVTGAPVGLGVRDLAGLPGHGARLEAPHTLVEDVVDVVAPAVTTEPKI